MNTTTGNSFMEQYSPMLVGHDNVLAQNAFQLGALAVLKEIGGKLTAYSSPSDVLKMLDDINQRI